MCCIFSIGVYFEKVEMRMDVGDLFDCIVELLG